MVLIYGGTALCSILNSTKNTWPLTQAALHSSRAVLLDAPSMRTKVTLGDRAFQVAAPKPWNSLPFELRLMNRIDIFKCLLKMYLFKVAFD